MLSTFHPTHMSTEHCIVNIQECLASALQAETRNTNPLLKNLSKLPRKNQSSFMQVSSIQNISEQENVL